MHSTLHRLAAALVACAAWGSAHAQEDMVLVHDGKSDHVLVLGTEATRSEERGARELQAFLARMSGAEIALVDDQGPLPERAILVGRSRHTDALGVAVDASLGDEGFLLRTAGERLVVAGGRLRGTMYGCYELLERLGVRFFTPEVTRVPELRTVTLPALDERHVPAFEYREPFFTEAQEREWAARNRVNGFAANLDSSTGGKISYHPFVHTFEAIVPPALFAEHPEYFSLVRGRRFGGYGQRCLTNPEVFAMAVRRVLDWIAEAPDATIHSVSQNDTGNPCECDACRAKIEEYGAPSGLYLWFVNRVAEEVEKSHPGKLIDTLAYQFTEAPPRGIVPRKNVRVRLCPISCCEAHPYESCSDPANAAFLAHLSGWSKVTDTLYIWHYNTDFAHYLMPFPDFDEFPAEIRLYRRTGVKGIFFEGAYGPGGGGSDAELRSWVMAKLLFNPDLDAGALVDEWMDGVYGAAARSMRQWFDLLHERVRDPSRHLHIYDSPDAAFLGDDTLARGDALFDEAERLAAADPVATRYVAKARLSLRYVKLARSPAAGPELDSFLADVRRAGIAQIAEGLSVDAWEARYRESAK
ncbi:MAG: DUF4838 domain-containing protein [Planctomycetes bacterium]|nr:DUF4838 domain-containing protein [Planctomycetota bacterium]